MANEQYWESFFDELDVAGKPYEPSHGFLAAVSEEEATAIVQQKRDDFKKKFKDYLHRCPCCDERSIIAPETGEQCDICGWYDEDEEITDPEDSLNSMSLNEAKAQWESTKSPVQEIKRV